jgi:hypothetical protein
MKLVSKHPLKTRQEGFTHFCRTPPLRHSSMEGWNLGDMDVSGGILGVWMPAIRAGMSAPARAPH